mmetsp:Transcript_38255/g.85412  ORF Transcript_38255/g.85412 Transcript_38255/m.85412 type:complete len:422 (+) Transcript_38255:64-1329(+)
MSPSTVSASTVRAWSSGNPSKPSLARSSRWKKRSPPSIRSRTKKTHQVDSKARWQRCRNKLGATSVMARSSFRSRILSLARFDRALETHFIPYRNSRARVVAFDSGLGDAGQARPPVDGAALPHLPLTAHGAAPPVAIVGSGIGWAWLTFVCATSTTTAYPPCPRPRTTSRGGQLPDPPISRPGANIPPPPAASRRALFAEATSSCTDGTAARERRNQARVCAPRGCSVDPLPQWPLLQWPDQAWPTPSMLVPKLDPVDSPSKCCEPTWPGDVTKKGDDPIVSTDTVSAGPSRLRQNFDSSAPSLPAPGVQFSPRARFGRPGRSSACGTATMFGSASAPPPARVTAPHSRDHLLNEPNPRQPIVASAKLTRDGLEAKPSLPSPEIVSLVGERTRHGGSRHTLSSVDELWKNHRPGVFFIKD